MSNLQSQQHGQIITDSRTPCLGCDCGTPKPSRRTSRESRADLGEAVSALGHILRRAAGSFHTLAMLTVLQTLGPAERAVFVLREVFETPYHEIAEVVAAASVGGRGRPDHPDRCDPQPAHAEMAGKVAELRVTGLRFAARQLIPGRPNRLDQPGYPGRFGIAAREPGREALNEHRGTVRSPRTAVQADPRSPRRLVGRCAIWSKTLFPWHATIYTCRFLLRSCP
jgi:hypothetical protein